MHCVTCFGYMRDTCPCRCCGPVYECEDCGSCHPCYAGECRQCVEEAQCDEAIAEGLASRVQT